MSEFKIGDRVEVIGGSYNSGIKNGNRGTIVSVDGSLMGVDFDIDIGGHDCSGRGRYGHCWRVPTEYLKKIEETKEETKADTLEQKILTALREEIGVEIGEEFDVYGKGEKQWTCKFEKNGFTHKMNDKFLESGLWKSIVGDFHGYQFKKKPLFPTKEKPYFYVQMRLDNDGKAIYNGVDYIYWYGKDFDIAMLITGNYFKTEEEAENNKEKVIEKMNKLLKDE